MWGREDSLFQPTLHPGQFLFQQKEGPVLILKAPQIDPHGDFSGVKEGVPFL